MANRWEWAGPSFDLVPPDELAELDEGGNKAGDYGLSFSTGSNGCMIYGSVEQLRDMAWEILAKLPPREEPT